MSDKLREKQWEHLKNLPTPFLETFIGSMKNLDNASVRAFGQLLSELELEDEDLEILRQSSIQSIATTHTSMKQKAESTDSFKLIQNYLMQTPLILKEEKYGVTCTVTIDAEGMKKGKEANKALVEITVPCVVTLVYGEKSIIFKHTHKDQIATEGIKNPQKVVKRFGGSVRESLLTFFQDSFYPGLSRSRFAEPWQDVMLDVYKMLWNHAEFGDYFRTQLASETLQLDLDDIIKQFKEEQLGFFRTFAKSYKGFSYELAEDNSVAFIMENGDFAVYTKRQRDTYTRDLPYEPVSKFQSPLYQRLQLTEQLIN